MAEQKKAHLVVNVSNLITNEPINGVSIIVVDSDGKIVEYVTRNEGQVHLDLLVGYYTIRCPAILTRMDGEKRIRLGDLPSAISFFIRL